MSRGAQAIPATLDQRVPALRADHGGRSLAVMYFEVNKLVTLTASCACAGDGSFRQRRAATADRARVLPRQGIPVEPASEAIAGSAKGSIPSR
jgi:hypothetical protein